MGGRFAHHPRRQRLGLGGALARLGVAERRFLAPFRLQHDRGLAPLGAGDVGLAHALGLEDHRALLALGLHLPAHRLDEVLGRLDVLDLDARDLDAPRLGSRVDDAEQPGVDLVAMREQLVEVHRAHDGADVGHHQVEQRLLEIGDLVGGAPHVEHLVEGDAVDRHSGVVLGDDLLARHVDDLLHDAELAADAVDIGNDEAEAGRQRLVEAAEAFDRVVVALRHLPHAHQNGDDDEQRDRDRDDAKPGDHGHSPSRRGDDAPDALRRLRDGAQV